MDGELGPKTGEMLTQLAENPQTYVDTGHVSADEAIRLLELKGKHGCAKIVASSCRITISTMGRLNYMVDTGALTELAFASYTAPTKTP